MLLPDKHISVAESLIGLGSFVLSELESAQAIDHVYDAVEEAVETDRLPAYHNFDSVTLAILFLYSVGAVRLTDSGMLTRCAS